MKYVFHLYVSQGAPGSMHAIHNLGEICAHLGADLCSVEIINVREQPQRAEEARILAIPTLVKLEPLPALRVIGDLGNQARILEALGHISAVGCC